MNSPQDISDIQGVYESAVTLHQQGEIDQAIDLYKKVLVHFPEVAGIHYNLGLACFEMKRFEESVKAYKQAAELTPHDSDIFYNLGLACKMNKQFDEAEEAYLNALTLADDPGDILFNLGCCYQDAGSIEQACVVFEQLLQLEPDHLSATNNLAYLYHLQENFDRARELYARVLEIDPDRHSAQHMFATLSGESDQPPSQEYVRELFDQFSEHFEENLLQKLEYNTCQTLYQAFDELPDRKSLYTHCLDLGCGTGLAGEIFRPVCKRLTGIDLSQKMMDLAVEKKLYDDLYCTDIIEFIKRADHEYDLIIAADVLPYLGDLEPLFSAITKRSSENAIFCLSAEQTESNGWKLLQTGRYGHNPDYVVQIAGQYGWIILKQFSANIRKEKNTWIRGTIFLLGKNAPSFHP